MDLNTGLVIGIDISTEKMQVCYYDFKDKSLKTDLLENTGDYATMIEKAVGSIMKQLKIYTIDRICVTVERFERDILDKLKKVFVQMSLSEWQYTFLSHEESYAYYAFNQKEELYSRGVMLVESKKEGLYCYLMRIVKNNGNEIVCENKTFFDDVSYENESIIINEESQHIIMNHIKEFLDNSCVSSVYLTGAGFDTDKFPEEFTHFLCSGQRAFVGQNLYAKGACMCAANLSGSSKEPDVFHNIILGCSNRVTTGIEVDILERNKNMRFRIVKPGTNWYTAERKVDFILDDTNEIRLIMRPCDGSREYEEIINLSEIPYRDNKTTRIGFEIEFKNDSDFTITVKDKGFGDLFKSSGKVIKKEISIR